MNTYHEHGFPVSNSEIDQALHNGHTMHAFRSGGGLRVVTLRTQNGEMVGYGEAPHVEDALAHAGLDFSLCHETYEAQYSGERARHSHYLTGDTSASSPLDEHILDGHTLDATVENGAVTVRLSGYKNALEMPDDVKNFVKQSGHAAIFKQRGVSYLVETSTFPNGDPCLLTSVLQTPNGVDPWMMHFTATGRGETFAVAASRALIAPKLETSRE